MEYEIALFPARADERSREVRVSKPLWAAVVKAVHKHGENAYEERYDPTPAKRFAHALRTAMEHAANKMDRPVVARYAVFEAATPAKPDPLLDQTNESALWGILRIFESGTGVVVQKATPKAIRAI